MSLKLSSKCIVSNVHLFYGMMTAKMYMDEQGKIIPCSIQSGGSIGVHKNETSDDINYVLSGNGKATCDGVER